MAVYGISASIAQTILAENGSSIGLTSWPYTPDLTGALRRGCRAALGARQKPWARRGRWQGTLQAPGSALPRH